MISAPFPDDEFLRLNSLYSLNILNTSPDSRYDSITIFTAHTLETPICLISLIDVNRQWFKSAYGLDVEELPRRTSICGHAICNVKTDSPNARIYEVCDTKFDARFIDNPLVIKKPWIQSYLGYVLQSETGHNIGTLCVVDTVPRKFSDDKKQLLIQLGGMVENLILGHHHLDGIDLEIN